MCFMVDSVCELFQPIWVGVPVILLWNVIEVLSVGGGALLDILFMVFQRMCVL